MTELIIDGIRITTYDDGKLRFTVVDELPKEDNKSNRSWFGKFIDWIFNGNITPYAKVRDLSDPVNKIKSSVDSSSMDIGPSGAEAGIRIRF